MCIRDRADDALLRLSLLPVTDFTAETAEAVIAAAWDGRDAFRAELGKSLPVMRQRAARNYGRARELLAARGRA